MACSKSLRLPHAWSCPFKEVLQNPPKEDLSTPKELVLWLCHEVKLADEDVVNKIFHHLKPHFFVQLMYPRLPSDPWSMKLYKLNVYFLVAAYVLDDFHMEKYPSTLVGDMVEAYDSVNREMDERFPDCPNGADLEKSLSSFQNTSARNIVVTMTDYINRSALIVWNSGRVSLNTAADFRRRMAGTLRAYLYAVKMNNSEWTKVSIAQYLWNRCPESGAPCFYISNEFFSGQLGTRSSIPMDTFYYQYLYGSAVCSVMNDLVSFYRDKNTVDVNIVKILDQFGYAQNTEAAKSTVFQLLKSLLRRIYNSTMKLKMEYPECSSWLDFVNDTTLGWVYIHTFTMRYSSSPYKIEVVPLEGEMLKDWLNEQEDTFALGIIEEFQNVLEKEKDKMKMLYAF